MSLAGEISAQTKALEGNQRRHTEILAMILEELQSIRLELEAARKERAEARLREAAEKQHARYNPL